MHSTIAGCHRQVKRDKRMWLWIVLLTDGIKDKKVSAER
jgi:hypothetical protein